MESRRPPLFPLATGEAGSRSGPGLHFHAHRNRIRIEFTSEDNAFPIESALLPQDKGGWRAAEPGARRIRLLADLCSATKTSRKDEPQRLRPISRLYSRKPKPSACKNSPCDGRQIVEGSVREIVRQPWNCPSPDAARDTEDYNVDLSRVMRLD
jgi:hypothetical protein